MDPATNTQCLFVHRQGRECAPSLDLPDMTKVCSACGATVARTDCHKNRYAEYVCRKCQTAGIKFTRRGQLRYLMRRGLPVFLLSLFITSLALVAIWALLMTLNTFSLFRNGYDAPSDASPIESAGQSAPPPLQSQPP